MRVWTVLKNFRCPPKQKSALFIPFCLCICILGVSFGEISDGWFGRHHFRAPRQLTWDSLLSESELIVWIPLLVGVLKFEFCVLTKRLFNFDFKHSKTVQIRYLTILDHQKSTIATKKSPTFWRVWKTVISKKRKILQKARKVWYTVSALHGDFTKNVFGWQYGAFWLLEQRNFIDHLERVLKCLSKIWSVRSRTWSQSLQNWSYFVCIYFTSF